MSITKSNKQFCVNTSINSAINRIFLCLDKKSEKMATRKIEEAIKKDNKSGTKDSNNQAKDVFIELIVGEYLIENGYNVKYGVTLDGKTPDWYDSKALLLVEHTTIHAPNSIDEEFHTKGKVAYFPDNTPRAIKSLDNKKDTYSKIISKLNLRYVISIHGSFESLAEAKNCEEALQQNNFFQNNPHVSGVLFSEYGEPRYKFTYFKNPYALRPFNFPKTSTSFDLTSKHGS